MKLSMNDIVYLLCQVAAQYKNRMWQGATKLQYGYLYLHKLYSVFRILQNSFLCQFLSDSDETWYE